jgi:ribosomal protein L11 methyltransferase
LLEVYVGSHVEASTLSRAFGGEIRTMDAGAWLKPHGTVPTRIGRKLEIIHGPVKNWRGEKGTAGLRLYIPHGVAFGSGEHATTSMLLRALVRQGDWTGSAVLDLGTGSGILALVARQLGARIIVATDFDPDAVRTAAQNEALNFTAARIRWQCADVKRLKGRARYDLVLANLFSGILVEAATQIEASVAPGGQLWLSGILRSQKDEVVRGYQEEKMKLESSTTRGKWVMLKFRKLAEMGGTDLRRAQDDGRESRLS